MRNLRPFNLLIGTILLFASISFSFAQVDTLYLSLSDALDLAQKKSPTSIEATIDKRSGLLNLASGISAILPTPSFSAEYTKSKSTITNQVPPNYSKMYDGSFSINQTIFDADVYGNFYKGKLYFDYYRLQAKDKTANLVYSVKINYYSLAKTYNLFEVAKSSLQRAEENYNLSKEKFRLGQITKFDLLRSETFKTQAAIDLLTTEKNLKVSMEELKGQLGIDDNSLIKPTTVPNVPDMEIDFASMFAQIFKENPTLKSSQKYKSISKTSFTQSIANILPSLNLFWSSSYSDSLMLKKISDWRNNDVISYGVRLNFPIFEIKSYLLNIGNTRNETKRADVQLRKAEILLHKTAINAIFSYKEAKERYRYASQNLELNRTLLRLAQEQYRLGAISQLDLFNTELNFNTAQNTYYSALFDTYTSYAQIEYLLGISADKE